MHDFCTYFDRNYLPHGLALYHSLRDHCPEFKLWVLCMDDVAYGILGKLELPGVHTIALKDFERGDQPLLGAKQNRSRVEYYFTCTPSLPLYIFNTRPEVDMVTYLDADLFFFADPVPIFEEMGAGSVAMIAHRFPPRLRRMEQCGIYNVGWLSFRRDEEALACLRWWRVRCIDWCYDRIEEGRFADQKYLDQWPQRFRNVVVLENKGANLAPWNLANYRLRLRKDGAVMVDEQPLIFFHFQGLKRVARWLYNTHWRLYEVNTSMVLRRRIYAPYLKALFHAGHELSAAPDGGLFPSDARGWVEQQGTSKIHQVLRDVLTAKCLFFFNGHVI